MHVLKRLLDDNFIKKSRPKEMLSAVPTQYHPGEGTFLRAFPEEV